MRGAGVLHSRNPSEFTACVFSTHLALLINPIGALWDHVGTRVDRVAWIIHRPDFATTGDCHSFARAAEMRVEQARASASIAPG